MQESRLFRIVYYLIEKGKSTAPELAQKFEVSARTIYRDIDVISSAGIPIYATQGKNGGIIIDENFTLDRSMLSKKEKEQILSGLQALFVANSNNTNELLTKLGALFHLKTTNWIEVDFSDWIQGQPAQNIFNDIKTAILDKYIIYFKLFGLDPVWWLQADHSLWAVIIANIWLGIPFNLVILYSGLQNINGDLYEAAALDGCNAWQRFWKITFPLLKPVSMITLLLGFVYTLRTVDIIWIMTKGTGSSRTLATWAYEMAFGKGTSATIRYSEASVVGTILIVVALIFALIYLWAQRNEEKR